MVWLEGNVSLKNPVTPPGIDPGTVRLVAQRLNHYATQPGDLGKLTDTEEFIFFDVKCHIFHTQILYIDSCLVQE